MKKEELFRTCVFGGYNKEDVMGYVRQMESELERLKSAGKGDGKKEEPLPREDEMIGDDKIIFNDQMAECSPSPEAAKKPETGATGTPQERVPVSSGTASGDEIRRLEEKLKKTGEELEQARILLAEKERQIERSGEQLSSVKEECEKLKKEHELYEEDYRAIKNVLLNARVDAGVIVAKAHEKARLMMEEAQHNVRLETRRTVALLVDHLKENQEGLDVSRIYLEQQLRSIDNIKTQIEGVRSSIENMCWQTQGRQEGKGGKQEDVTIDEEFEKDFFSEDNIFGADKTDTVKE